jgi:hypothetical protein
MLSGLYEQHAQGPALSRQQGIQARPDTTRPRVLHHEYAQIGGYPWQFRRPSI